jgi:hypothetical protein
MGETHVIQSQVLVVDHDETALRELRDFCSVNHLVGFRVQPDTVLEVLRSNIHLGAIFLSDGAGAGGMDAMQLGAALHKLRAELPIFLRRERSGSLDDLPDKAREVFTGAYQLSNVGKLKELVDSYVFSTHYPGELVRGIRELTIESLQAVFRGVEVECDTPYIVRDKLIYGELFSLMPLESDWCRGYMMFQTDEKNMLEIIRARKTQLAPKEPNFRDVNSLLSEIANIAWGSFKSRFFTDNGEQNIGYRMQVPIIINHGQRFISFGTDHPQLCLQYRVRDRDGVLAPITLYQKFVFSLHWSPEKFMENQRAVDNLLDRGELELF